MTKDEDKSEVLRGGFCLFDSETEQTALYLLQIFGLIDEIITQLRNQMNNISNLYVHKMTVCLTGLR